MYVQWLRLKDCRAVSTLTVLNPRSPEEILVAVFFVARKLEGSQMKRSILFAALCGVLALPAGLYVLHAHAGVKEPDERPSAVSIVTDPGRGTITFMIDGKSAARIDRDGLRVVGNIEYGGTITDTGRAYAEKAIAGGGHAQ
jgi:hypothetical protein